VIFIKILPLGTPLVETYNYEAYSLSIMINLILGLIVGVILLLFSRNILSLINVPTEMMDYSNMYLSRVGFVMFTVALFNVFDQIARSNGNTSISLILTIGMNVLNIIGNYMFLYGPLKYLGMGIIGVAYSTIISKCVGLVFAYIFFAKVIKGKLGIKYITPFPKDIFKLLLSIGIPAAGENFSYDVSQLVIASIINLLGVVAVNTRMYCTVLTQFSYLFSMSVAIATSIIVGQAVGAGQYEYAFKRVRKTLRYAMIVSLAVAFINYLLSPYTLTLFTNEVTSINSGTKVMFVALILEIGRTCNIVIIYSLKAAGDVKFPTMLGIVSEWAIAVTFTYILTQYTSLSIVGAWIAMAIDELFRAVIVFVRWNRKKWQSKGIFNNEENNIAA